MICGFCMYIASTLAPGVFPIPLQQQNKQKKLPALSNGWGMFADHLAVFVVFNKDLGGKTRELVYGKTKARLDKIRFQSGSLFMTSSCDIKGGIC